jgi:MoaA/NifB/PqqE/SkfB family radical SAM enzyme
MLLQHRSPDIAEFRAGGRSILLPGEWVGGGPWERFGLYDSYVVVRPDGAVMKMPAHAGELVPGSTEDLSQFLRQYDPTATSPLAPMTMELDPTYACASKDCGGRCFSFAYRRLAPAAQIETGTLRAIISAFADAGGRVVRFDGGGDPLSHPAVRTGDLVEFAHRLRLKTTILTSGDLLPLANHCRLARAECYLRVSLNAASDETRRRFHGSRFTLSDVLAAVRQFVRAQANSDVNVPVGATFLLDSINYREVAECARLSRESGVSHFSVRRVLGPSTLRPTFSARQLEEIDEMLGRIREMNSYDFRTFVPWRRVDEPDLSPAADGFGCSRCWQSTVKTVIEPSPNGGEFRAQLCGRYRGGGIGQQMQMAPLIAADGRTATSWVEMWRRSFVDYAVDRKDLPRTCVSCIDRGFILMFDRLVSFLTRPSDGFEIFHLRSGSPGEYRIWEAHAASPSLNLGGSGVGSRITLS